MLDLISNIGLGFSEVLQPHNLLYALVGVLIGTIVGILPGLSASSGIVLLLPLTIGLGPVSAFILLAGIYYGAMHGGIVTAILIATPGEPAAVVTVMDGHQLARQGKAGRALTMSAVASFVSGTLTIPFVMILAPALATLALRFGPPETAALMLLGILGVVGFVGKERSKGLAMAALGILISTVGHAVATGAPRFTFGSPLLVDGIDFVFIVIGVFAIAELLQTIGTGQPTPIKARLRDMTLNRQDWRDSRGPMVRGGALGFLLGILPGAGATIASFLSYDVERRVAKRKGITLGTGRIEGVTGPQAADNAAVNGAFVPALALGIPGSTSTAVLLGAFILHGIQPGPLLFQDQPDIVWPLICSFYVGNVMLLLINVPLAPVFASMLRFRYELLYPIVIVTCLIGGYAVESSLQSLWIVFGFGIFGYVMGRYGYPFAPLALGAILGGMFETALGQSLQIGRGSPAIFLHRPIALLIFALAALLVCAPFFSRLLGKSRRHRDESAAAA